jgi:hypothetical protein
MWYYHVGALDDGIPASSAELWASRVSLFKNVIIIIITCNSNQTPSLTRMSRAYTA